MTAVAYAVSPRTQERIRAAAAEWQTGNAKCAVCGVPVRRKRLDREAHCRSCAQSVRQAVSRLREVPA